MKRLILLAAVIAAASALYVFASKAVREDPVLNQKVAVLREEASNAYYAAQGFFKDLGSRFKKAARRRAAKESPREEPPQSKAVTVYLKHGGTLSGKLIAKRGKKYTVEWKGSECVLDESQISRIEDKTEKDIEWHYKNDVVVARTNGIMLDGRIKTIDDSGIVLSFDEGGGEMEMTVPMPDVNYLMFAPVFNAESAETEKRLKKLFPKMRFYREGNYTLVTDSSPANVNSFKRTIRSVYTDIYVKFFPLFKARKPMRQNFVVVFDNPADFAEYCYTDGVPYWLVLGYFSPTDKTLYLYNAFGDKFEGYVFAIAAKYAGAYDKFIEFVKSKIDKDNRYEIFIDALAQENKNKLWDAYNFYRSELTSRTTSTLRHEFTHELFHNWGLQDIIFYKPKINKDRLIAKKKEFLDTEDIDKKKKLLDTIMGMSEKEVEDIEMEASESWTSEGLATYFGTEPAGSIDENWLFTYQEMAGKNELNPIEFFTNYKMGSFPGLCNKAAYGSYAQSWAFTTFLINKYPGQFMDYQAKVASQESANDEDKLGWLLSCLRKDLPQLEKEFADFMKAYPAAEDPDIRRFMRYHEIFGK